MHLLIIDGLNLIRRIYAVVERDNPDAVPESLLRCGRTLNQLMEQFQPTHAVVCFDGSELSWRHLAYEGYKAGRKPMPEPLQQSLRAFRQQFAELGIASLALPAVEADDLAATLICKMLEAGGQVSLVSTDKGFGQLLNLENQDRLLLWNHFDRVENSIEAVNQRFGVQPWQLVDYWALCGDSTNQIPGVAGVGAKTAASLLAQFESLDEIYANLEQIDSPRQRKLLADHQGEALLSRRLVTLDKGLELACNLKDFRCKTGSYPHS